MTFPKVSTQEESEWNKPEEEWMRLSWTRRRGESSAAVIVVGRSWVNAHMWVVSVLSTQIHKDNNKTPHHISETAS